MRSTLNGPFLQATLLAAIAMPALAADGVLEISQPCAVQTGCFAGDAPGFPVTLAAAGSYVLTSNLDAREEPVSVIEITAADVTLDLGSFLVEGYGSEEVPVIRATADRVAIRNGTVAISIELRDRSSLDNIRLASSGVDGGVVAGAMSLVLNCNVDDGGTAITVGEGSLVLNNHTWSNFSLSALGSVIAGNSTSANDGALDAGSKSLVSDNSIDSDVLRLSLDSSYRSNRISTGGGTQYYVEGGIDAGGNLCTGLDYDLSAWIPCPTQPPATGPASSGIGTSQH